MEQIRQIPDGPEQDTLRAGAGPSNASKKLYVGIAVLFVAVLTLCGILTFALPHRTYSENENRNLSQFPMPEWNKILEGDWQEGLADFLTDQFPGRDVLTASASSFTRLIGIRDISGAYVGKDGYYFEMIPEQVFDRERYRINLLHLERFASEHPELPMTALLVPDAGIILSEKLPSLAELYDAERCYADAERLLASLTVLDVRDAMTNVKGEGQLYYRTDHHWTTFGAYVAYTQFLATHGQAADSYADYLPQIVTEDFLGTLYSKVLDTSAVPDVVETVRVSDALRITADGQEISLYVQEKLQGKDKYQVFLGGNYGKVVIENPAVQNGQTLLVIKDSYANCFVPFLTEAYERIVLLDLRYFGGKTNTVSGVLSEENVTEVLFLYQLSGFAADQNLGSRLHR